MNTSKKLSIVRWRTGKPAEKLKDDLAWEEPLEIRVDNHPVSVTMRTPGHDEELAAGFLLSEGLIRNRDAVLKVKAYPRNIHGNVVNVFLSPHVSVNLKELTRHVFASSSCGLCGKATIAAVKRQFPGVKSKMRVDAAMLAGLPEKLKKAQATFDKTGGLHAAAIFDDAGELVIVREDVGRHNAVDKVLGHALLQGKLPLDNHILVVSGRASFEILQKALAANIPIIAAVSAPSTLAVEFAAQSRQTLVGFVRGDRLNIYSHASRVRR